MLADLVSRLTQRKQRVLATTDFPRHKMQRFNNWAGCRVQVPRQQSEKFRFKQAGSKVRIRQASEASYWLKPAWQLKKYSKKLKIRIFNSNTLSALLYSSVCWNLNQQQERQIIACKKNFLWRSSLLHLSSAHSYRCHLATKVAIPWACNPYEGK